MIVGENTLQRFSKASAGGGWVLACLMALLIAILGPIQGAFAAGKRMETLVADRRTEAFDLESGVLLYRGETTASQKDGILSESTIYWDPGGRVLQTIELKYDFESLRVIRYRLVDPRSGETETVTASDGRVNLTYKSARDEEEKAESMDWDAGLICTELIRERIRGTLEDMAGGKPLGMELLVPSRLGTVNFQVELEGDTEESGIAMVVARAEPAFWLFRMMVAPLRFYYSATPPHQLLEYRGRASVKTDEGDPLVVRLVYYYEK